MIFSRSRSRSGVLDAAIITLAGLVILVGLGIWQLDRKAWKDQLSAKMTARLTTAPVNLPPREQWGRLDQGNNEFRRVMFPAEFIKDQEALVYTAGSPLRPDVTGAGYWVLAPARLPGGSVIVVNRGFVPADRKDVASRPDSVPAGVIDITGVMRWPEPRGLFTPADEPKNSVWFLRDHRSMAQAKDWGAVASFYIDQEEPQTPGGLPRAGKLTLALPNNHLQYALTWFGLAAVLVGVYLSWLISRRRRY